MKILDHIANILHSHLKEGDGSGKTKKAEGQTTIDSEQQAKDYHNENLNETCCTEHLSKEKNEEEAKGENLNIIEIEENIKNALVKSLEFINSNDEKASRLALNVFLINDKLFNSLCLVNNSNDFIQSLKEKIDIELGVAFKSIQIYNEKPSGEKQLVSVEDSHYSSFLFYTLEDTLDEKIEGFNHLATISALEKSGSILEKVVKLQPIPNKVYNIGRGKMVRTSNGMLRVNHIIIDNSEQSDEYENNKYVSSNHAHITYLKDDGFVIYVDSGGTRIKGNRTRILRDGLKEPIDLGSDTKAPVPLENGDVIELGKHVLLEFKYS